MDDQQIEEVIYKNLPDPCVKHYYGNVTSDELSKIIIKPKHHPVYIIATILPSTLIEEMGHWVCFYVKDNVIYVLDSFGIKPENYSEDFVTFFLTFSPYHPFTSFLSTPFSLSTNPLYPSSHLSRLTSLFSSSAVCLLNGRAVAGWITFTPLDDNIPLL